ncbi:MAG TPA: type I-C CRISPR-associated protein Cas7/Csd2 [Candidatus Wallbacteria bacterium]|nr:type I-C CRISPR-associated protein Cas7/Csd2 [Candidatus Wallbacteria bacterium]
MSTLKNKIDFAVVINVKNANPNGDPLNGNRPRTNYDGLGEISDVCIKRKIRNRLMDAKLPIFVQSDDNKVDGYNSLRERAEKELKGGLNRKDACAKWLDVRAFGQVFAFKNKDKAKGKKSESEEGIDQTENSVSIGIRGPVSIHSAFSVNSVSVSSIQITKSVSGEGDGTKKASDTMGMKHRIDHGVYVFYGSMNPQLASLTGFSDEDAAAIKEALRTLFQNDSSSARPEGSMEVYKLYWWKHAVNIPNGQYSSAKVHRSLKITPRNDSPKDIIDYEISLEKLDGLEPEVIDGQ